MKPKYSPIITLTTDFGRQDGYVGTMQGVILSICPEATLTDLTHQVPPQDIQTAAFILYQSFAYYPPHTVHCVVIDPGVGSKRRAVAISTDRGIFVGPDNGVFSFLLTLAEVNVHEAVTLTNPVYQLEKVSATFHGRDIFAPAAAHIAAGVPLREFGPSAINLVRLESVSRSDPGQAHVIHIDHFGNLVLNITAQEINDPESVIFKVGSRRIESLRQTFTDVAEGKPLAYVGSIRDHIEIAIRNGNAARTLGVCQGDVVSIEDA